jgi:hypothetical protein
MPGMHKLRFDPHMAKKNCCNSYPSTIKRQRWLDKQETILKLNLGKQELFLFFPLFETEYLYVAQTNLKLDILLPQPPLCWDYRHAIPHVAFFPPLLSPF